MITFTQKGDMLEGPEYLVQFTRGEPVSVTLSDTTFCANSDIANPDYAYALVWENASLKNTAVSTLKYNASNSTCTGTIGRAATMCAGLTYVAFVAIDVNANITIGTLAATVDVRRSVDAEGGVAEDATSILDAINDAVDKKTLKSVGYDGNKDLGKIAVVNKDGDLAVRSVHLLIDDNTDGESLVLRGAVGQEIASITINELQEALGTGSAEPEIIKNSYWSGYKYPDGHAVLRGTYTVNNLSVTKNTGMYVTSKLFNASYRKYPALFIEKPELRATYIPDTSRVHMGVYASYQAGNSDTVTDGTYQTPPDIYLACGDTGSQTLKGTLNMAVEGRWK